MTTAAQLNWLELPTEDAGRWTWSVGARWPFPLASSGVGRWEPELDELLGEVTAAVPHRGRGEERLLETVAKLLLAPAYCAYVIRAVTEPGNAPVESHFAALAADDDAVVVVDEPGRVRLARVHWSAVATTVAAQLPALRAAPTVRIELPAQTAALLESGFARPNTSERTLRGALDTAGIPAAVAERLFADPTQVRASGTIGAVRYAAENVVSSPRGASWTELPDGGMLSAQSRAGQLVWEPLTAAAVGRALADALTGLGSVREGSL